MQFLATAAFQLSSNKVELGMSSTQKRRNRTDVQTRTISTIEDACRSEVQRISFLSDSDRPPATHPATLNEIQIRAYRIHQEHGAVNGGYTLDDWLEAEHELDDKARGDPEKEEQVH
jgi:hypothetical protein